MRTTLKISHAHSIDNGIQFYSKRHKGYASIATVDNDGNIKTEWTTIKKYKKEKNKCDKNADRKKLFISILCKLPFVTIFVILLEWTMSKEIMLGMRFFFLGYAFMLMCMFLIRTYAERKKRKTRINFIRQSIWFLMHIENKKEFQLLKKYVNILDLVTLVVQMQQHKWLWTLH